MFKESDHEVSSCVVLLTSTVWPTTKIYTTHNAKTSYSTEFSTHFRVDAWLAQCSRLPSPLVGVLTLLSWPYDNNGTVECFFFKIQDCDIWDQPAILIFNLELKNACTKPLHTERLEYHNYIRAGFSVYKQSIGLCLRKEWSPEIVILLDKCCALFRPRSG